MLFVVVGVLGIVLTLLLGVNLLNLELEVASVGAVLLIAAAVIAGVIGLAAFTAYSLATAKGEAIDFMSALRLGYRKAGGYLGLMALEVLLIILGLIVFIIPGLLFIYWFLLAPYIYMNEDIGVVDALRKSKRLVQFQPAEVFGLIGVGLVFALPGFIPLVGTIYQIFYNAAWYVALSNRYLSAEILVSKKRPKPETHMANYWAIGLAVLGAILLVAMTVGALYNFYEVQNR